MDANSIESHYPTVMGSISGRLLATDVLLELIKAEPREPQNWLRLDCVALQVRKICELFLLGSTLAHLQEGSALDPKKWRPSDTFKEIEKFNEYALPLPLEPDLKILPHSKQFVPGSKPMPFSVLASVYRQCSNILHVPSAHKVLQEKVHPFEWEKFRGWVTGFTQILKGHLLLLPEIKQVVVCTWTGKVGEPPHIFLLGGAGEAVLNTDALAEFSLVVQ